MGATLLRSVAVRLAVLDNHPAVASTWNGTCSVDPSHFCYPTVLLPTQRSYFRMVYWSGFETAVNAFETAVNAGGVNYL